MKNQLKKVAIGVDTTCLASDNSGSETNAQGAVAMVLAVAAKFTIGYTAANVVDPPMQTFGSVRTMADPVVRLTPNKRLECPSFA